VFGFIVGTLCLFGLAKVAFGRHGFGRHRYGYARCGAGAGRFFGRDDSCEYRGDDGPGGGDHKGFRGPGRWALRGLFSRLEATPSQQRTIEAAVSEFFASTEKLKEGWKKARTDLAAVLRSAQLDDAQLHAAFAGQDILFEQTRASATALLTRVHATLDEEQRRRLAEMLESGRPWSRAW
jgi:hypothetical protein